MRNLLLAFRNVARRARRSAISISAVAFGIVALILAGGFIEWIFQAMREDTIHSHLGHVQIAKPGYFDAGIADPFAYLLPEDSPERLSVEALPYVKAVAPRLALSGLISHGDSTISFMGDGVSPRMEDLLSRTLLIEQGQGLSDQDSHGIIMGAGLASNLGVRVGDRVVLLANTASGGVNAVEGHVRGLFSTVTKAYDDAALRLPIALAQQLLRTSGAHRWIVLLEETRYTEDTLSLLRRTLPEGKLQITPWYALADFYSKTVTLFSKQVAVMKLIIAAIIVLSISNTLMMNVMERTGEIGTSMALGVSSMSILRQFVAEGVLLGVIGGVAGLVVGVLLAHGISAVGIPMPPPPGMARGFTGGILVTPRLVVDAVMLALVTTLLASLYPAWKASRMVVVDALRHNRA